MASADLSRRADEVVGYPPRVEVDDRQRREFQEALLDADSFEDLPGEVAGGDPQGRSGPTGSFTWSLANSGSRCLLHSSQAVLARSLEPERGQQRRGLGGGGTLSTRDPLCRIPRQAPSARPAASGEGCWPCTRSRTRRQ
jgi:hypothetical protein